MRLHDPYGTLVIAAPEYYWTHFLTILIHTFVKLHPQVKLKLVSCNSGDVIRMVTSREADVGIIAGQNRNEELEFVSLDAEELLLVIRKDLHQNNDLSAILQKYPLLYNGLSTANQTIFLGLLGDTEQASCSLRFRECDAC